jgi:vacuolar-type H+-ATPase subunit F/Vma7
MRGAAIPVYLGDEVSAAGWRLAGVHAEVPAPGTETAALDAARQRAPLVLLSAALAAHIDAASLERAASALAPLVLVVPDPQGRAPHPDLARRLRTQLGLEA